MLSPFKRAVYTETGVVLNLLHHNVTPTSWWRVGEEQTMMMTYCGAAPIDLDALLPRCRKWAKGNVLGD